MGILKKIRETYRFGLIGEKLHNHGLNKMTFRKINFFFVFEIFCKEK